MSDDLECRVQEAFEQHGVAHAQRDAVLSYLQPVRVKDRATYEHCLRVGLLAARMGEYLRLDAKALLYAGLLHDIGKALVPRATLQRKEGFDDADRARMQPHPEYSHHLLQGVMDFTADIVVRHHRFQENGYPAQLPELAHPYSEGTQATINYYAMILSLADFYDALVSRENDKFGTRRRVANEEARKILLERNPHARRLIGELYDVGVFGEAIVGV